MNKWLSEDDLIAIREVGPEQASPGLLRIICSQAIEANRLREGIRILINQWALKRPASDPDDHARDNCAEDLMALLEDK